MRYQPHHKAASQQRILDTAARLFRAHGYDGVGIDTIMAEAGLTRGAFYGHFASKENLFEAVLKREADFVVRMRRRDAKTKQALTEQALDVVHGYLAPQNSEKVANGCIMASLSIDAARASRKAKRAFADTLRELTNEFTRGLPRAEPLDPRALASLSLCVGGLILSRAVGDTALAERILAASEAAVAAQLGK
jgi:AcrR family transcriptional regulator